MAEDNLPITVTSIMYTDFISMIESLSKYYTEEVEKQDTSMSALDALDEKIRRYTNYYSYLTELFNYAQYYTRNAPDAQSKSAMIDKRDALEKILKSMDLKIKAASRMITVRELKIKEGHAQGVGQVRNAGQGWNNR